MVRLRRQKFKVKLTGMERSEAAILRPPFDVVAVFGRRGRIPVRGTINGHPYRSSLMDMGDGHMMVVNAEMRTASSCRAGDTVEVVMSLDEDERTVEVPAFLKEIIDSDPKASQFWPELSFTHRKEYVREIEGAKKPETRTKRIAAMMDSLRKNERKKS